MAAYGADAVRFYFMAHLEFGKDGDFSEARFRDRVRLERLLLAACAAVTRRLLEQPPYDDD